MSERYTIAYRPFAKRWYVYDRQREESIGRGYTTRERAIAEIDRLNAQGAS